jgi:hypothetical protein
MRKNRLVSVFAIAFAGVLLTGGCVSASAQVARTAAATAVRTLAVAGGKANIMIYAINSDGPHFRTIVTGAVGDYGPAVSVYPNGKIDPEHNSEMKLKLAHGSFRLRIAALDKKFVKAASHDPTYPGTCSTFVKVTSTTPIVAGSGTGSYRGISGSFQVTATADEVHPRPCHPAGGFLWQVIVLTGAGTVSFRG